jgi:hypothetical protein
MSDKIIIQGDMIKYIKIINDILGMYITINDVRYYFDCLDNKEIVFKNEAESEHKMPLEEFSKLLESKEKVQTLTDGTSEAQSALNDQNNLSSTSATDANPQNKPQDGGFQYDVTSSMNSNIFKRTNLSETSITETANLDNLFSESAMSSTLDLSEFKHKSSKKNIFTPSGKMKGGANNENKTLNMIRQKLQDLQSSTIGMSIQNDIANGQTGGKQMMTKNRLNEMGINSSSTSDFCQ